MWTSFWFQTITNVFKQKTSVLWQKYWTIMKGTETVRHQEMGDHYKTISREIQVFSRTNLFKLRLNLFGLQRLDANWRKGRYTQTTYLLEANIMNHSFRMADNYLITMPSKSGFNIIDRRTMKVRHVSRLLENGQGMVNNWILFSESFSTRAWTDLPPKPRQSHHLLKW